MYPESEAITLRKILWNTTIWTVGFFAVKALYKFVLASPVIMDKIHTITSYIF
jgi:hypothetical protein